MDHGILQDRHVKSKLITEKQRYVQERCDDDDDDDDDDKVEEGLG